MCQTAVYLDDELILENVVHIEFIQKTIKIATLFEAPTILEADIKSIDLLKGRVKLDSTRRS